jgi:hypothetical protein
LIVYDQKSYIFVSAKSYEIPVVVSDPCDSSKNLDEKNMFIQKRRKKTYPGPRAGLWYISLGTSIS